ncbi:MAG: tail fiber domain-containing protein [Ignavibacteriae bacterium]|nr:tail fiber domain-containing protein [Ignavibacteriota bacterium]
MKQIATLIVFIMILFCVSVQSLFAQSPTFSVQGVLRDPNGRSVTDATYSITFKLYEVDMGGSHIWTETQPSVPVSHGVFVAELGSVTALPAIDATKTYYLGFTVAGGTELTPRVELTKTLATITTLSLTGESNVMPSSGNVGIGTKTPASKLSVDGDVDVSGSRLHVGTDGNIGIGTTTPSEKFEINGNAKVNQSLTVGTDITMNGQLGIGTNAPASKFSVVGDVDVSGSRLHVGTDGNIGIGTATPQYKLDVNGQMKAQQYFDDDVNYYANLNSGGRLGGTWQFDNKIGIGTATPNSPLEVNGDLRITSGSTGKLYFADGSSLSSANLGTSASSLSNPADAPITADGDGNGSGSIVLNTGSTERMRIANNGNVGIGTTSPGAKLAIGSSNISDEGALSIHGDKLFLTTPQNRDADIDIRSTSNSSYWTKLKRAGNTFVINQGFNTGNVDALAISDIGNIGIGTLVPASPLAVRLNSGGTDSERSVISATLGDNSTTTSAILTIRNAGNRGNIGNVDGSALLKAEFNNATAMIIDKNGNIGIGTTSPGSTLHIEQASPTNGILLGLVSGTGKNPTIQFSETAGSVASNAGMAIQYNGSGEPSTDRLAFLDYYGNERFTFLAGGNVGIGTNGPRGPLEVTTPSGSNKVIFGAPKTVGTNSVLYFDINDANIINIQSALTNNFDNPRDLVLQAKGGNVGIGITSPTYKLEVAGPVRARQFYDDDDNYYADLNVGGKLGGNWTFAGQIGIGTTTPSYNLDIYNGAGEATVRVQRPEGVSKLLLYSSGSYNGTIYYNRSNDRVYVECYGYGQYIQYNDHAWHSISDMRLKKDIVGIENGLDKVMKLRPVSYKWNYKEVKDKPEPPATVGFIAQEVEKVIPIAVDVPKNDTDYYGLSQEKLIPYLTKAIQEQQALIEKQSKEMVQMSERTAELERLYKELQARVR